MKEHAKRNTGSVILHTIRQSKVLSTGILLTVAGAVIVALLPPLVLEWIVDRLSIGETFAFLAAVLYFGLIALAGLLESGREILLTVFGQRITRSLRRALDDKLSRLTADDLSKLEPGVISSRFIGDVDTVENLFTSGIISMAADLCKVVSIFVIIGGKNPGLAVLLLLLVPVIFGFTRFVQKRSLKAQLENRKAVAKVTNHVPETIKNIRTIHTLEKEAYMEGRYGDYIGESYAAIEKTNFFDSVYSPVILILNAVVTAVVMVLSASGIPVVTTFFGMSVGTAVAVISYISQVFGPLESIGMEIQTIQSAVAGIHRIDEFLALPERWNTDEMLRLKEHVPCVELKNVCFGYVPEHEILHEMSLQVQTGEHLTLAGRTGAGKSTLFKLLLGQYQPWSGQVLIYGQEASLIPDSEKRRLFGYVEQTFHAVPGTVADQIRLFDESISLEMVEEAARIAGLHETITKLHEGYQTSYAVELFSQGQRQLLSIARAIAARPKILLLDEITANLDADTEQTVLAALQNASINRTVLSISHRLYEQTGGKIINII
ncbi:MAG: ABC transporter ATP-binding protein/permease [Lachnospiraceae bacterium]|nr:ABC transporter ATP-binding protein/permease [Lachnospiraceae bacterium]